MSNKRNARVGHNEPALDLAALSPTDGMSDAHETKVVGAAELIDRIRSTVALSEQADSSTVAALIAEAEEAHGEAVASAEAMATGRRALLLECDDQALAEHDAVQRRSEIARDRLAVFLERLRAQLDDCVAREKADAWAAKQEAAEAKKSEALALLNEYGVLAARIAEILKFYNDAERACAEAKVPSIHSELRFRPSYTDPDTSETVLGYAWESADGETQFSENAPVPPQGIGGYYRQDNSNIQNLRRHSITKTIKGTWHGSQNAPELPSIVSLPGIKLGDDDYWRGEKINRHF